MIIGGLSVPGPGYGIFVDLQIKMPTDDLSGNTSVTEKADKGIKPKKLMVTFSLRKVKKDFAYLTKFLALAEAKNSKGEAKVYIVIHPLAQSVKIRQMRFSGSVSVIEDDILHKWDLSFTLEEFRSVPEALEKAIENRVYDIPTTKNFEDEIKNIEALTA